ncbi:MAG: hypothetical protein ACE15C_12910 [Phycisphaerae bacterium]
MRALVSIAITGLIAAATPQAVFAANGPDTAPAQAFAVQANVARTAAALAAAADSPQPDVRKAAHEALQAILEAYYEPLAAAVDDGDVEVRLRVHEAMEDCLNRLRLARALTALSPAQRANLEGFQRANPKTIESIFSPAERGTQLLQRIFGYGDTPAQAEPVLVIALLYGSDGTARMAAGVAAGGGYKSDDLVDALTYVVIRPALSGRFSAADYTSTDYGYGQGLAPMAAKALAAIANRRPAAAILAALLQKKDGSPGAFCCDTMLAEALAGLGDKRAVPALAAAILAHKPGQVATMEEGAMKWSAEASDAWLYCLLRLSEQNIADYQLQVTNQMSGHMASFKEEGQRAEALAKLAQWWEANKVAYADVKPLAPADLKLLANGPQPGGPATRPQGAGARPPDAAGVKELCAAVSSAMKGLIEEFHSERLVRRESAQASAVAILQACIDALLARIEDGSAQSAAEANAMLAHAAAVGRLRCAMADMSKANREKLAKCRQAYPQVVEDIFSLERYRSLDAIRKLGGMDDPGGVLEPLLLYCLGHSSQEVALAAVDAAGGGKYKSDEVVDSLARKLASFATYFNWFMYYYPQPQRMASPQPGALMALKAIKTPRAAAALATILNRSPYNDLYRNMAFGQAIEEIGERRIIPILMDCLSKQNQGMSSFQAGDKRVTWCEKDVALSLLVKLTGQDIKEYKFVEYNMNPNMPKMPPILGFAGDNERSAAIKRFQDWWEKNKSVSPWKDLKAPEVPDLKIGGY